MKPYSEDLRVRVLAAYDSGERVFIISKQFSISQKTIYLWIKHRKTRDSISPIIKYQKGHSHKITDLEYFKEYVDKNPSFSSREIANHFKVNPMTILRALRKINYTQKKRLSDTSKGMKKSAKNLKKSYLN